MVVVTTRFWHPHLSLGIPYTSVVSWISPLTSDVLPGTSCECSSSVKVTCVLLPLSAEELGVSASTARSTQHSPNRWQSASQEQRLPAYLLQKEILVINLLLWFSCAQLKLFVFWEALCWSSSGMSLGIFYEPLEKETTPPTFTKSKLRMYFSPSIFTQAPFEGDCLVGCAM